MQIFITFQDAGTDIVAAEEMLYADKSDMIIPDWAQKINVINPLAHFMKVIRMITLKGSGFSDIRHEFFALLGYAFVMLTLSVWRYKKTA